MFLFLLYVVAALFLPSINQNITYFSYTQQHYWVYIIIIVSTNIYLTKKCLLLSKNNEKLKKLTLLTALTMLIGSLLPYHLDSADLVSSLHVIITIISNILLFYLLALFIEEYKYTDYSSYCQLYQLCIYCLSCVSVFFLFFGFINIIVELSILASILVILRQLTKKAH